jgi:integrase
MGVFKRKNKNGIEGNTWYVTYYNPGGKRIIKAIGPKKREAEDYLGKMKAAIRENRFFDIKKESRVTFKELLDEYLPTIEGQRFYQNSLRHFVPILKEQFGGKLLSEIDYKTIEEFRNLRKKTPTQHGGERSKRTVDIELSFLRRILNKAVKWEMLEKNPLDKGEDLFYGTMNKRERALTEDEVKRLVEACPPYLKPIVIVGVYTGLRKGDLLSLRWKDTNLQKGIIRLTEQKTGSTRIIVLNNDTLILLKNLPVRGEYIFPARNGKPFKDVKRSFQTALKEAGIEQSKDPKQKIVFHTLRHTCVSLLTERGADTTMVQNYVAHASEEMTKHYTHVTEEYARKTGNILNGLLEVSRIYGNKMETTHLPASA